MKKLLFASLFFLPSISHAYVIKYIQLSTIPVASIQPGTSNYYFFVASGTSTGFNTSTFTVVNSTQTGDEVMKRSTQTFTSSFTRGTLTDSSTTTFQQATFNGTKTDNSTTTNTGGNSYSSWATFSGSMTITGSTINYSPLGIINGTRTDNSTTTRTGSNVFQNGIVISTTLGSAKSVFDTGTTSITIKEPLNVSTSSTGGIAFQVNNSSISLNAPSYIMGTTTNDNALTGYYGESFSSTTAVEVSLSSNVYNAVVSVTLTAGDWDVSASGYWNTTGVTVNPTNFEWAISTSNGNNITGAIIGESYFLDRINGATANLQYRSFGIPPVRRSIGATTTYYLKMYYAGSPTLPTLAGRISARRVR